MMSLREGPSTLVRREDYAPPAYWIDTVELSFDLDPAKTRVLNRMRLRRNTAVAPGPLRLDGEDLNLARVLWQEGRIPEAKTAAQAALNKGLKKPEDAKKILALK